METNRASISSPNLLQRWLAVERLKSYLPRWLLSSKSPIVFPFNRSFNTYDVAVPLKAAFRFAHEPIKSNTEGRFIGRQAEMEGLVERILFSDGGSFLITGYRGVGKTSFVNQVIRKLEDALPWAESFLGETRILDIHLSLARPLQPCELMHHIIRRVYRRLEETGIYHLLTSQLREELTIAHHRTSVNMTRKLAEAFERNFGFDEASLEAAKIKARIKFPISFKRSRSHSFEASFLGYDDKAAENDIMQISRQLSFGFTKPERMAARLKRAILGSDKPQTRLKIVLIFDELDKLEEGSFPDLSNRDGVTGNGAKQEIRNKFAIDEMLSSMKNLFTTSGISFVFVAGKDLQERWLEDLGKGDSIYESVFSYDKYLPCMWIDMSQICDAMVDWDSLPQSPAVPAPGNVICPRCGKQNPLGGSYCRFCGTPIRTTAATNLETGSATIAESLTAPSEQGRASNGGQPPQSRPIEEKCPSCGIQLPTEVMFCDSCGAYCLDPTHARNVFGEFKKYLYYKGRGIPRRIIRGFNEYVLWNGRRPVLVFSRQDIRRIRFYAKLQDILEKHEQRLFGSVAEEVWGTQQDKRRLGVYYLMDWMLRQGDLEFTLRDAVEASKRLSAKIAPAAEVAPRIISDIVDVLLNEDYLMEVQKGHNDVQIGDIDARSERRYRLTHRRLTEMGGLADIFEEESFVLITQDIDISRVAKYRLLEIVGKGGMATVYRSWDEQSNRLVAVKILSSELASNPQAIERFKREAEVMRTLKYPNIAQFYQNGLDSGRHYIAMEYIEGVSLRTMLRHERRLELASTLAISKPLAEALQYLHSQGFVRSDIKPDNILINTSGRVFLIDFSIVKKAKDDSEITLPGVLVGTPRYMAPEQASGQPEDQRSDVYSFGVVFYEMLTGELPIEAGDSAVSTVMATFTKEPVAPSFHVDLPEELEALILKCLNKDPQARYRTMGDVISALMEVTGNCEPADLTPLVKTTLESIRNAEANNKEATRRLDALPRVDSTVFDEKSQRPIPSVEPLQRAPAGPYLRLISGPVTVVGQVFPLTEGKTNLGRSTENDIVLESVGISRFHAAIATSKGQCRIEDLNSNNGTLVNDVMIRNEYLLHDQDKIRLGEFLLTFENGQSATN